VGATDPVAVLAFAVLIDREKAEEQQGGAHPTQPQHHAGFEFTR